MEAWVLRDGNTTVGANVVVESVDVGTSSFGEDKKVGG